MPKKSKYECMQRVSYSSCSWLKVPVNKLIVHQAFNGKSIYEWELHFATGRILSSGSECNKAFQTPEEAVRHLDQWLNRYLFNLKGDYPEYSWKPTYKRDSKGRFCK